MSYEIPLVLEIQKRPCLYNHNLPEYNRKDLLDAAWTDIAAATNATVYECKDKWKNIRSSFVRSLRTKGGKSKKPYYLTKYLQFLIPYLKGVGIDLNVDESQTLTPDIEATEDSAELLTIKIEADDDSEQITDDPLVTLPIEIEPPKFENRISSGMKRRRNVMTRNHAVIQRKQNKRLHTPFVTPRTENNAMKYFLLSLLPELDTMDEDQVRLFKIKVMMLIDDIKLDSAKVKEDLPSTKENIRLQKRLINLLLRNLEKKLPDD